MAQCLEHAADCQDFAMNAPVLYVCDASKLNSYMLRVQSVQGPNAGESDTLLARRVLGILTDAGIICTARIPRSESFLKPAPSAA